MKNLVCFLLLACMGCGVPAPKKASPVTGPPVPNLPSMSGTWSGSLVFTASTNNLTVTVTQDPAGNLSGTASSVPPFCEFNVPVAGKVYANNSFYLQTADNTTASFAGSLSNGDKTVTGNVGLGKDTGCGPQNGTFNAQLQ